ncbi:MAG TPA: FAD-dependent oxidoreductase [Cyclobacteriaceae bacterium]
MKREKMLRKLEEFEGFWDVIIIGGGATGLGCALDAASRGYSTILLEQSDFAKGTSSRSTKLAHGGVRYLQQGDISLVYEALQERGLMLRNAPHLVKNQAFVIPNYEWWDGPFYNIGLKVYEMMAGKLGLGPTKNLSVNETLEYIPTVETEGLKGGVIYYDGQFDDARLALNIGQTAAENDAVLLNYMCVNQLLKSNEYVNGVMATDLESRKEYQINGRVVINATGVFADGILKMDRPESKNVVAPSQGVHIVLDKSFLPGKSAIMVPKTADGRVLFAVPWNGVVVVGTTDTPIEKTELEPKALEEEVEFILEHAAIYLKKDPDRKDVLSVFTGLRPLIRANEEKNTSRLSRSHSLFVSDSGLVTITGGKWTTYRKMAEDTIDKAALISGLYERESVTKNMRIHGWLKNTDFKDPLYFYGTDLIPLRRLIDKDPELGEKLHEDLPYLKAQVVWAVRKEMARTVEDVLSRRTRAILLNARASEEIAPKVAKIMADELEKDKAWVDQQITAYSRLAKDYYLEN